MAVGYHPDNCHGGIPHSFTSTVDVLEPNIASEDCDNRF